MKIRLLCEETWRFSGGEREIGEAKHAHFFRVVHLFFFCLVCFLLTSFNLRKSPFLVVVVVVRTTLYIIKKCFSDTIYISKFVVFSFVFVIVHNFFYPHFPIRIRHPQVSGPRFGDTSFTNRFFELFTLPASLKLNIQRRSAPSMSGGGRTERPYFCDINEMNYRVQNNCVNYWHHVLYVSKRE